MNTLVLDNGIRIPVDEIRWRFSRSSGPGGQNVNKVSSRVTLLFDVSLSKSFSEQQRDIVMKKLARSIDSNGILQIHVDEERSQLRNREIALARLTDHLNRALKPQKKRKATRIPQNVDEKRILMKKSRGRLKRSRRDQGEWA